MNSNDPRSKAPHPIFRLFFGGIPLGIGLTVLIFLWGSPFGEFGSPPLFFRVFGSFVALGFVGFGLMAILGMQTASSATAVPGTPPNPRNHPASRSYRCPHCGAVLGEEADVSPSGDVKCAYCKRWFNIHA